MWLSKKKGERLRDALLEVQLYQHIWKERRRELQKENDVSSIELPPDCPVFLDGSLWIKELDMVGNFVGTVKTNFPLADHASTDGKVVVEVSQAEDGAELKTEWGSDGESNDSTVSSWVSTPVKGEDVAFDVMDDGQPLILGPPVLFQDELVYTGNNIISCPGFSNLCNEAKVEAEVIQEADADQGKVEAEVIPEAEAETVPEGYPETPIGEAQPVACYANLSHGQGLVEPVGGGSMSQSASTITLQLMDQRQEPRKSSAAIRAEVEAFVQQVRREQERREAERCESHHRGRARRGGAPRGRKL